MSKLNTQITTQQDLETLVQKSLQTDAVALDTEFVWEHTYNAELGLIQIALSDEECYLIDPLALQDIRPLGRLLSNRSVVKILHDAPQDLVLLGRATESTPQNIFDTRLAAGFSNMKATHSLSHLVEELLGISLSKNETRTNWLKRPLTEKQIAYALDDVRYLRAIRVLLLTRIIGPKIKSWLQEELNLLNNPSNYTAISIQDRFRRVRGSKSLSSSSLAILKNLTIWREGIAQKNNKPRGHIVKDSVLVEIAKKQIKDAPDIEKHCKLSNKLVNRYGETLANIVQTTLTQEPSTYPEPQRPVRLSTRGKKDLENLTNYIELKCKLLSIDPALIGNGSELKSLVKTLEGRMSDSPVQSRQVEGWRKLFLHDFIRHNKVD